MNHGWIMLESSIIILSVLLGKTVVKLNSQYLSFPLCNLVMKISNSQVIAKIHELI